MQLTWQKERKLIFNTVQITMCFLSTILIIIISFICLRVFENDGSRQEDKRSLYSRSQISSNHRLPSLYAHAHTSKSTRMALRTRAFRVKLLVNRCNFHKFPSFVGVRSLSDNVSSKPVTSSAPESTGDHLIYTQEHFALKDSLRKVWRIASIAASVDFAAKTAIFCSI